MTIEEVIDRSVLAVFRDETLSREMVLKGGCAIRMLEGDHSRLSVDADFSIRGSINDQAAYFGRLEKTLTREFAGLNFDLLDFKKTRRPKTPKPEMPAWWRGWLCEFKLVAHKHAALNQESRRRHALIPKGASSPKIEIEISEHEYCDLEHTRNIGGVLVHGYTRESLVLEKLRAICQQHPEYKYRSNKDRARDFFDIYRLCQNMPPAFFARCHKHLPRVFAAKDVPPSLLKALWDTQFLESQSEGFQQVRDSTRGKVHDFAVYVEFLRYLVGNICPEVTPSHPE